MFCWLVANELKQFDTCRGAKPTRNSWFTWESNFCALIALILFSHWQFLNLWSQKYLNLLLVKQAVWSGFFAASCTMIIRRSFIRKITLVEPSHIFCLKLIGFVFDTEITTSLTIHYIFHHIYHSSESTNDEILGHIKSWKLPEKPFWEPAGTRTISKTSASVRDYSPR